MKLIINKKDYATIKDALAFKRDTLKGSSDELIQHFEMIKDVMKHFPYLKFFKYKFVSIFTGKDRTSEIYNQFIDVIKSTQPAFDKSAKIYDDTLEKITKNEEI